MIKINTIERKTRSMRLMGLMSLIGLLWLLPLSGQAQIKIGGNVYGGGNKGYVGGNTRVTVKAGDIGARLTSTDDETPLKNPKGKGRQRLRAHRRRECHGLHRHQLRLWRQRHSRHHRHRHPARMGNGSQANRGRHQRHMEQLRPYQHQADRHPLYARRMRRIQQRTSPQRGRRGIPDNCRRED